MEVTDHPPLEALLLRKERELHAVAEIIRSLGQALPLSIMLNHITSHVANLLQCTFCAVLLRNTEDGFLTIKGAFGLDPRYIELVNAQRSVRSDDLIGLPSSAVYRSGQPLAWEDVRIAPDFAHLQEAVQLQGYVAMAAVPLIGPDGMLGTLNCYYTKPYLPTPEEFVLLTTIAGHAAIAIHAASLLAQLHASVAQLSNLNRTLEHQHALLAQSEAIHRRFTTLVLQEQGLPAIVETLAALLDRGVCLYDRQLILQANAHAPSPGAPEPVSLSPRLLTTGLLDRIDQASLPIRLPASSHLSTRALLVPIVAHGKQLGYLALPDAPELSGELEQQAIEHAATVCALELLKQRNTLEVERRMRGNFLSDLLAGCFATEADVHRRATYLGYDVRGLYRVLAVDMDRLGSYVEEHHLNESQVEELKQLLIDLVERVMRQAHPRAIVAPQGDRAVILFPVPSQKPHALDEAMSVASHLIAEARQAFSGLTLTIGISTQVDHPTTFGRATQEALEVLTVMRNFDCSEAVMAFDDLGLHSLLLRSSSRDELLHFAHRRLDPLVLYERRRSSDLLHTLEIALTHGLSPQRTAVVLCVHPNTVKHRLHLISDLTGMLLDDAKNVLELQLALLVRRLSNKSFDASVR